MPDKNKPIIENILQMQNEIQAVFEKHGVGKVAFVIGFAIPPEFTVPRFMSNMTEPNTLRMLKDVTDRLTAQMN